MSFNEMPVNYTFIGADTITDGSNSVLAIGNIIGPDGVERHYNFHYRSMGLFEDDLKSGTFEEYCLDELSREL